MTKRNSNRRLSDPEINAEAGDYWYEASDITKLLNQQQADFKATYEIRDTISDDDLNTTQGINSSTEYLKENPGPVVIPYNLGNQHWTALVLSKNADGKIKAIYQDSLGNGIPQILNQVLTNHNCEIVDLQVKQQNNSWDCGPWTVHNLDLIARNPDITSEALKEKLSQKFDVKAQREFLGRLPKHLYEIEPRPGLIATNQQKGYEHIITAYNRYNSSTKEKSDYTALQKAVSKNSNPISQTQAGDYQFKNSSGELLVTTKMIQSITGKGNPLPSLNPKDLSAANGKNIKNVSIMRQGLDENGQIIKDPELAICATYVKDENGFKCSNFVLPQGYDLKLEKDGKDLLAEIRKENSGLKDQELVVKYLEENPGIDLKDIHITCQHPTKDKITLCSLEEARTNFISLGQLKSQNVERDVKVDDERNKETHVEQSPVSQDPAKTPPPTSPPTETHLPSVPLTSKATPPDPLPEQNSLYTAAIEKNPDELIKALSAPVITEKKDRPKALLESIIEKDEVTKEELEKLAEALQDKQVIKISETKYSKDDLKNKSQEVINAINTAKKSDGRVKKQSNLNTPIAVVSWEIPSSLKYLQRGKEGPGR